MLHAIVLVFLASHAAVVEAGATPQLGWLGRGVLGEPSLKHLEEAIAKARQGVPANLVQQRPAEEDDSPIGCMATYVHDGLQSQSNHVLKELQDLAWRAAEEIGWAFSGAAADLRLRCACGFEFDEDVSDDNDPDSAHRGWQGSGQTLVTLLVPLTSAATGANDDIEVRRLAVEPTSWKATTVRGDIAAWRGWDEYRLQVGLRGRRALVLEWWLGVEQAPLGIRPADSENGVTEVLGMNPNSAPLHLALASLLQADPAQDRFEEAVAHFASASALAPMWERAAGEYGAALGLEGRVEEAEVLLNRALQLRPTSTLPYFGLSQLKLDTGRADESLQHLKDAVQAIPKDVGARIRLGVQLSERSDVSDS